MLGSFGFFSGSRLKILLSTVTGAMPSVAVALPEPIRVLAEHALLPSCSRSSFDATQLGEPLRSNFEPRASVIAKL